MSFAAMMPGLAGGGEPVIPFVVASGFPNATGDTGMACELILHIDGTIECSGVTVSGGVFQTRWLSTTPSGTYYARGKFTAQTGTGSMSGNLRSGTIDVYGSWFSLTGDQRAGVSWTSGGARTATFVFDLSADGSTVLYTSPSFKLTAVGV